MTRLVAIGLAVEPVVEVAETARDERPLGHRQVRLGPVGRQHRIERERHEQRHEHRAGNRQRERRHPLLRHAAHERDRHEHDDDRERRRRHREADFSVPSCAAVKWSLPMLHVTHDVLAHDDRIVDEDADGERQAEQRHRVQREAAGEHGDERRDHRHRQRQAGDDRRAPRVEEQEHREHREERAFDERGLDAFDRVRHARARVAHDVQRHAGRQRLLDARRARRGPAWRPPSCCSPWTS